MGVLGIGIAKMISSSNRNLVTFSCIIAYFVAKNYSVSGAKDTLGVSESLKLHNGEILESSNKRYRFLSDHSSSFLVIQFVYLNHSINVWAANSYLAAPARPRISAITMNESGRLEVYGHGNSDAAVFTVNAEQKVMIGKTSATLLDNGNFVLRSRSGHTVWQSFDYPADDTWLPSGMKLGISLLSQRSTTCCLQRAASGPSLAPSPGSPSFPVGPSLAPASGSPSFPVGPSRAPAPVSPSLPPGPPSGRKKSKNLRVKPYVVGATIATFLASLVLLFWCCKLQKRKGNLRKFMRPGRPELDDKGDDESLFFSFTSIEIATDHFSEENKLGQGGFGPVYKGKLVNGLEIAVKRLNRMSGHGIEQFKNEVKVISKLQHRNLVRLLGSCIEKEERLLVYEYLPNNSLDSVLFDAAKRNILDWKRRLKIIEGVAQGLLYLHKYSRLKIIHRDLKTSNVLLDADLNPKISDFGTARIFGENEMRGSTMNIVGTYGYMSPEYAMDGVYSEKSDVFSFGVMILEIISGKKNTSFYDSDRHLNLIGHVWDLWTEGRISEITDSCLDETISTREALKYVHVGLLCVQEKAADRPTMSDVVSMLLKESMVLASPKRPAFAEIMTLNNTKLPQNPEFCSLNEVTISDVQGR
ncbi:G-type lectin S-receptor-like serine/threonine-protein kinase At1g11410 [Coffea arabica]|uniref:non-specific serine/threonine protein kinase n=1 Tax=Coffea arabica TaxID=13443 RepID=A0A6P6XE66_COFAR|nr:G-type lectin S-receptor-like serine/threonine-protein kinase RKS1 [Coffea arabica]